MDEFLQEEWPMWRLVTAGIAGLHELETYWSLDDVIKANAVLDCQRDCQAYYQEKVAHGHHRS